MKLKLALTGAHSTGKTTLLQAIQVLAKSSDALKGIEFLPEITRQIKSQGYDINEQGTVETQLLVLAAHVNNVLLRDFFLVDRAILDGYVYTHFLYKQGRIQKWVDDYALNLLLTLIDKYDALFFLPPEIPLMQDGVRSVSKQFHDEICDLFYVAIGTIKEKGKGNNIYAVSGDVDARVAQIKKILKSKGVYV